MYCVRKRERDVQWTLVLLVMTITLILKLLVWVYPKWNGVAKRMNCHLLEVARFLLCVNLPNILLGGCSLWLCISLVRYLFLHFNFKFPILLVLLLPWSLVLFASFVFLGQSRGTWWQGLVLYFSGYFPTQQWYKCCQPCSCRVVALDERERERDIVSFLYPCLPFQANDNILCSSNGWVMLVMYADDNSDTEE